MSTHAELRSLVERYGDRVLRNADDLRATLDDFLSEGDTTLGEINLLVDAVRLGAHDHLASMLDNGVPPRTAVDAAGARLAEARGGNHRSSCWAVAVLGYALGRVPEADVLAYQSQSGSTALPPSFPGSLSQSPPAAPPTPPRAEPTLTPPAPRIAGAGQGPVAAPWPPTSQRSTSNRTGLWVALVAVVVAALVIGGVVLLSRDRSSLSDEPDLASGSGTDATDGPSPPEDSSTPDDSTATDGSGQSDEPTEEAVDVAACGSEPDVLASDVTSSSDAVVVTLDLHATCSGGQYVDASTVRVEIAGASGDLLASGTFDFSEDALWVPDADDVPEGSTLQASFPIGAFWAVPSDLSDEVSTGTVTVSADGSSSGTAREAPADLSSGDETAIRAAGPAVGDAAAERASEASLRRQLLLDAPEVSARIVDRWVPQLSSKSYGVYDEVDDLTYDYDAIYQNHVTLRLEHPEARLLWSGDWASFETGDYWVTVAGEPFATSAGALDWCAQNGLDDTQCYAKRISQIGTSEDNTAHAD